jgi:D-threo-aldose 1-dehydrogenase
MSPTRGAASASAWSATARERVGMQARALGATGLTVSPLCFGTSPLGSMPRIYGYEVEHERAVATVRRVLAGPITFVDTSNGYGLAEQRIGEALREEGGLPEGTVLATKVDPAPGDEDFSGRRARQSVAESRSRLGLEHLQLVYLHDPERISFDDAMSPGGPVEALEDMRDQGIIGHIGVAGGPIDLLRRYIDSGRFEVVITHNRFTLADRSAEPLLRDAGPAGVAVVNGAPFGGGILVKGPDAQPLYAYRPCPPALLESIRAMASACRDFDVPLAAAALQFSMREPRITSTIVGFSSPERLGQTIELAEQPVPDELWSRLDELAPDPADGIG